MSKSKYDFRYTLKYIYFFHYTFFLKSKEEAKKKIKCRNSNNEAGKLA